MKVLCVSGFFREDGNTAHLLEGVKDRLRQLDVVSMESISLADRKITDCMDCGKCSDGNPCGIDDDMQPLYDKVKNADALVLASPVYMWNLSGLLKCFLDRLFCVPSELEDMRVGLVMTGGGGHFDGADLCADVVRRFAAYFGMEAIEPLFRKTGSSSSYMEWNAAELGAEIERFCGELTQDGQDG